MKKTTNAITLVLLFLTCLGCLLYSNDLKQNNKETVFLTQSGIRSYDSFKISHGEKNLVVAKKEFAHTIQGEDRKLFFEQVQTLRSLCEESCEIISSDIGTKNIGDLFTLEGSNYFGLILIGHQQGAAVKKVIQYMQKDKYWKDSIFSGVSYTNLLLDKYSESIKKILFPLLFAGIFIFLIILSGSFITGALLFIPCLFGAAVSLALIKSLLSYSNLITSIIPVLIFVLSLSLVLHIYYTACEFGGMREAIAEKRKPLLLMVLTTFIGFSSLYFSDLNAIQEFGILTASLILISAIISLMWLIQLDNLIDFNKKESFLERKLGGLKNFFSYAFSFRKIIISSFLLLIIGGYFLNKIPIITDANQYFPKKSNVETNINDISKNVAGVPLLEIIIQTSDDSSDKILAAENDLKEFISKNTYHMNLLSKNTLNFIAMQNMLELQQSEPIREVFQTLMHDYENQNTTRLTILSTQMNVDEFESFTADAGEILDQYDLKYDFNGLYYHLMVAQKNMIITLFKSFFISLIIISLLAFIFFKKIRLFFIFIAVNVIPVFASFIVLKTLGISFNIATVMTYSISLGLIVDSSFHIIHALEKMPMNSKLYFQSVVLPIIGSTLVLCISFALFAVHDFLPIKEFGMCLAIILFIGMIYDLKILPRLFLMGEKTKC